MPNVRPSLSERASRASKYRNWDAYIDSDDDEPEGEPFKDLIQRDPVVCDNCFLLRYVTVTFEWWRGSFGWSDYDRWISIPDANERIDYETAKGNRLACANCGHRSTKDRPVPKDSISEYTDNISRTLDAKDIEHERDVLFREVRARNTSENQGKQDSDVFSPAVRLALETSR